MEKYGEVHLFFLQLGFPIQVPDRFFSVNVTEIYHVSFIISFNILITDYVPDFYNEKRVLCAISSL
jgi:hypothetical protein